MKTDKKIEEMKVKYQLEKWGKYIDGEVITFTWKEFFKMMDNYTPNTEVQKAREEAVEKYKEEQAKSILEKGNPDWLGFDTPDRKLSKKYKELLKDKK